MKESMGRGGEGGGEREGGRGREERESCREHSDFNIHEHAFIKE